MLAPRWPAVLIATATICLWAAASLASPVAIQHAIDEGLRKHEGRALFYASLAFGLIALAVYAFQALSTYFVAAVGQRFVRDLRVRLFSHLQRLSMSFYDRENSGRLIARMTADMVAISEVLNSAFTMLIQALLLLIGLAVYDAISVYKTKHMVTLADAAASQRLPIMIVIPRHRGYSFLRQRSLKEQIDAGEEREAMFMGLGDVIIPGILVVSSFVSLGNRTATVLGVGGNLVVALVTIVGTLLGFAMLMRYVMRGNPQAGLPLLNSGAIGGYVIAYLAVYRDLGFGIG